MDSGCLEEGEDLEHDFDFSKPLSAGQVVSLMDDLMCREVHSCATPTYPQADLFQVAWHKGYPLSQTLFTSIHIDRLLSPEPKQLADSQFVRSLQDGNKDFTNKLFRAYCLGLIKCCDLVHTLITSQHYYEARTPCTRLVSHR